MGHMFSACRVVSMRGPHKLNLPKVSGMLRSALGINYCTGQTEQLIKPRW